MTSSQHRSLVFGETAETYDSYRPGYLAEAVEHVMGLCEITSAVEIGAGTGKATSGFARSGLEILCLEPSSAMATVLKGKNLAGVTVEVTTFEDWDGAGHAFDLMYAAQSWHWVDHATAWTRARANLRPGGVLALLWNVPLHRYDRFVDVYQELGPEILDEHDQRVSQRDDTKWLHDLEANGFVNVELFVLPRSVELTAYEFRQLYSTYSDHMMIPQPRRSDLLNALETSVTDSGGSITIEYEARVFTGLR